MRMVIRDWKRICDTAVISFYPKHHEKKTDDRNPTNRFQSVPIDVSTQPRAQNDRTGLDLKNFRVFAGSDNARNQIQDRRCFHSQTSWILNFPEVITDRAMPQSVLNSQITFHKSCFFLFEV